MSSQYDELLHFAADFWQWRAIHQPVTSDDLLRIERPMDWQLLDSSAWPVSQQVDYRLMGSALARMRREYPGLTAEIRGVNQRGEAR